MANEWSAVHEIKRKSSSLYVSASVKTSIFSEYFDNQFRVMFLIIPILSSIIWFLWVYYHFNISLLWWICALRRKCSDSYVTNQLQKPWLSLLGSFPEEIFSVLDICTVHLSITAAWKTVAIMYQFKRKLKKNHWEIMYI